MKKSHKLTSLLLAAAMTMSLAACGSTSTSDNPAGSDTAENTTYKIAMITDYGDITDESFNQTTYEACKAFADSNDIEFNYYKPSNDSTESRISMVDAAVADGYNILVMPGYAFGGTLVESSPLYPDVKFIALDVAAGDILEYGVTAAGEEYDYNPANWNVKDYYNTENTYCAIYQEELSGYMAGYAAVKMGYHHLGFLGGMAVPAVIRFGYGYVQGANDAAVELGIAKDVTVEYVYGNLFSGDPDITAVMDTWYQNNGTEIVFACGGGIYTSAAEAAAKTGGKIIGVDTDQSPIIDAYGEGMTVTSALKGLAVTVNDTLTDIVLNDKWDSYAGQIQSLGLVSGDDPALNYVQLPLDNTQWNDTFTEKDYADLVSRLYDGSITVSSDTAAMPETEITVNEYGNIK